MVVGQVVATCWERAKSLLHLHLFDTPIRKNFISLIVDYQCPCFVYIFALAQNFVTKFFIRKPKVSVFHHEQHIFVTVVISALNKNFQDKTPGGWC